MTGPLAHRILSPSAIAAVGENNTLSKLKVRSLAEPKDVVWRRKAGY